MKDVFYGSFYKMKIMIYDPYYFLQIFFFLFFRLVEYHNLFAVI